MSAYETADYDTRWCSYQPGSIFTVLSSITLSIIAIMKHNAFLYPEIRCGALTYGTDFDVYLHSLKWDLPPGGMSTSHLGFNLTQCAMSRFLCS